MNKKKVLHYISFAMGIMSILVGLLMLLIFAADSSDVVLSKTSVLMLVTGAVFIYMSVVVTKRALHMYIGLNLCFIGIMAAVLKLGLWNLRLAQVWPLNMIFLGLTLFPSGYYRFRRVNTSYAVPGVIILSLGLLFSLFSFGIIDVSFSKIMVRWWPLLLILLGVVLIVIFQVQSKNQDSFPYIPDDDDDEEDDSEDDDEGQLN